MTFSAFDLTESSCAGDDSGGYAVERLVRRAARMRDPGLLRRVTFDSEASMFCAYGRDLDALHAIAMIVRGFSDTSEEDDRTDVDPDLRIDTEAAGAALLAGFVRDLDEAAQREYYRLVPRVPTSPSQRRRLHALSSGGPADRAGAARRISAEARTRVGSFGHYLADPRTVAELVAVVEREEDASAYEEELAALAFIVERHLPDLRLRPVFEAALEHSRANARRWGVAGATSLYEVSWEKVLPLRHDRSGKVRQEAVGRTRARRRVIRLWQLGILDIEASLPPQPPGVSVSADISDTDTAGAE